MALSASYRKAGPSDDPPMPTTTTFLSTLPVAPRCSPLRTRSAKASTASRTSCTWLGFGFGLRFGLGLGFGFGLGVHLRDDVDAAHLELLAARRAQRHVQHGPPLRVVDLLARGHGSDLTL